MEEARGGIYHGTVGWPDDGGTESDLGDSANEGNNLFRVTLFSGREPGAELDQTQAQGQRILCQLASHVPIPVRHARVVVAVPEPIVPGGGVIIGVLSNDWQSQANSGAGELVLKAPPAAGTTKSAAQIMLRANGTIVFRMQDSSANDTIVKFGPGVFQVMSPAFSIAADQVGIRIRHWTGTAIVMGGAGLPGPLAALGAFIHIQSPTGFIKNDAPLVMLGPDLLGAAVYQPVIFTPNPSDGGTQPVLLAGMSANGVRVSIP